MVEVRRVVVIHRGRLIQVLGEGFQARRQADGSWQFSGSEGLVAGGAGTAPRPGQLGLGVGAAERGTRADVTALLDPQQYAAVSAPGDEPLLVLGSAGSGKTTVALHRLARLAAAEPETTPLDRARVVVPEEGLARLSARLLAPLGGASGHRADARRGVPRPGPPRLRQPPAHRPRPAGAGVLAEAAPRAPRGAAGAAGPAAHDGSPSLAAAPPRAGDLPHRPSLPRGGGGPGRAARCRAP